MCKFGLEFYVQLSNNHRIKKALHYVISWLLGVFILKLFYLSPNTDLSHILMRSLNMILANTDIACSLTIVRALQPSMQMALDSIRV